jgi:quinol monooxygenase YgiN
MELFIFARFQVWPGNESAVAAAIADVVAGSREEHGCIDIHAFRSTRDPLLFYIHSHWRDEGAFAYHATLPHTLRFIETVEPLIDHPLEIVRTTKIV